MGNDDRELYWVGSSKSDLRLFPREVQSVVGFALRAAQKGTKHISAKPLKGFSGAGVLEIVESFDGNAYRCVYTVRLANGVYVLHCFQKKSRSGVATPVHEMETVRRRLTEAATEDAALTKEKGT